MIYAIHIFKLPNTKNRTCHYCQATKERYIQRGITHSINYWLFIVSNFRWETKRVKKMNCLLLFWCYPLSVRKLSIQVSGMLENIQSLCTPYQHITILFFDGVSGPQCCFWWEFPVNNGLNSYIQHLTECAWGYGNDATYTYVHTCCVGVLMIPDWCEASDLGLSHVVFFTF